MFFFCSLYDYFFIAFVFSYFININIFYSYLTSRIHFHGFKMGLSSHNSFLGIGMAKKKIKKIESKESHTLSSP